MGSVLAELINSLPFLSVRANPKKSPKRGVYVRLKIVRNTQIVCLIRIIFTLNQKVLQRQQVHLVFYYKVLCIICSLSCAYVAGDPIHLFELYS